jgi:hypothetical protein
MAEQITVSQNMLDSLNATRPWVKFVAIVGFVMIGLMVLGALLMFAAGAMAPSPGPMGGAFGPIFGVLYLLFAALYFFPCRYMYRYAKAIANIPASGQGAMEEALRQQKSWWKFVGILTLILVVLYVVIFVGAIGFGVLGGLAHHG